MPTKSHNVRAPTISLWLPGMERARTLGHTSLAAVIRSLIRAYLAGEVDDVVERWLPKDGADTVEVGPQTGHPRLPFPP